MGKSKSAKKQEAKKQSAQKQGDRNGKNKHDTEYVRSVIYRDPPRKNVLLLSCMDQRLLDNTVQFMNDLNLQNRYDHVIFAGAAMGAGTLDTPRCPPLDAVPWKDVFFHHLEAAIVDLKRPIKDIILLEHLDCGAYKALHKDHKVRQQYKDWKSTAAIKKLHRVEAKAFAKEIDKYCQHKAASDPGGDAWQGIKVHCLIMDLLGKVEDL